MKEIRQLNTSQICIFRNLVCLVFVLSISVHTQTRVPALLPPAAQDLLDKGIAAARLPDYLVAIQYFEEARKIAPDAPIIYFNLGLAESKIPGRELRAICWFGAYLAAEPRTPNAASVREQMTILDVKNRSDLGRLIKTMESAARLVPPDKFLIVTDLNTGNPLHETLVLYAKSGDVRGALQIANEVTDPYWKAWAQAAIGFALGSAGDDQAARKAYALALITSEHASEKDRSHIQIRIAEAMAKLGDIDNAMKTKDGIRNADDRTTAMLLISQAKKVSLPSLSKTHSTTVDWLNRLDDDNQSSDCPLNTRPFLDLADYLRSLPQTDVQGSFNRLRGATSTIIKARIVVLDMLKRQAPTVETR